MIAAVPLLSIALGVGATDIYYRKSNESAMALRVQSAAYTTLNLQNGVEYADKHLRVAMDEMRQDGLIPPTLIVQAQTATELMLRTSAQAVREWQLLSQVGAISALDLFREDESEFRQRVQMGSNPQPLHD